MALKDKAVLVIVFMVFVNGVPALLFASGVAADAGIDPAVSGGENIDNANAAAQQVDVSGGFGETLFALYTSLAGPFQTILSVLFGAELMLISLGAPGWVVNFLFLPKFLIGFGAIAYVLAGRLI